MSAQKIGISGGTFDPIHVGHLAAAEFARERFGLEKVIFMTSGMPPHKDLSLVTDALHRHAMVRLSLVGNPFFEASDIELVRKGLTYTYNSLEYLKSIYPGSTLYFITGADVLPEICGWRNPKGIFSLCELIALLRPGYSKKLFRDHVQELSESYNAVVHAAEPHLFGISSSNIRRLAAEGKSIKYLVTDAVEEYIRTNKLYVC